MKQQTAIIDCSVRYLSASGTITCHLTSCIYFTIKFTDVCISPKDLSVVGFLM